MKQLKGGSFEVRLVLAPDVIAFAEGQAKAQGFGGVEDYLTGILNTAMLEERERAGALPPLDAEGWQKL